MITTTPSKTLAAALLLAATTTHALAQDAFLFVSRRPPSSALWP